MYHVVVAEDEMWIRSALVKMIEGLGSGFKVVGEASSGEEAWYMIQELWPSILVTDIMMPTMNGLDLAKHIHAYKLPIVTVVISGYDEFEYARQAIRYDVSDYLLKPVSEEQVQQALLNSKERLYSLQDEQAYMFKVREFLDQLFLGDGVQLLKMVTVLISSILRMKGARPGVRLGFLRIIAGRLNELIASLDERFSAPPMPENTEDKVIIRYFEMLVIAWLERRPLYAGGEASHTIKQVYAYLEKNYMNHLTLSAAADHVHLSPSYFSTLFKQYTGETFVNYLNGIRIAKAKILLVDFDIKIYEVAELVGFASLPYFNRVFKQVTQMTPKEFRNRLMS
ncbi:response regulator [Paenibacillus sp. GM2]|uniref:response regulator n=1 Tax=Paenibacillus sp. GM2 TaxID=1622070 RepID=UPI000840AEF0|nr:response regulator [Paenibacillus sp. GM2]